MLSTFKKATLATALAATAATGAFVATPAQAHGGDAAGAAIIGGIIGLGVGAAIASDHHHEVVYANAPYGYGDNCYEDAWGGCYPVDYYYQSGWSYHDGYWWGYDGHRYARPFVYGGYRGGYGYHGGAYGGYRGGGGGYRGGYSGQGWQGRDGYRGGGQGGGDRGGDHGGGDRGGDRGGGWQGNGGGHR